MDEKTKWRGFKTGRMGGMHIAIVVSGHQYNFSIDQDVYIIREKKNHNFPEFFIYFNFA